MHSLVLKIFIWFWAAMALVGLALYFTTQATMSERADRRMRQWIEMGMSLTAQNLAYLHEKEGPTALARSVNRLNRRRPLKLSFLNEQGDILAGPELPPEAKTLAMRAIRSGERQMESSDEGRRLVAQAVISTQGRPYVLVGKVMSASPRFPRGRRPTPPFLFRALGIRDADPWTQVFGLLAMFLTAGIVCYGLARYLTAPLVKLRAATQKLTEGDLTARVGQPRGGRRDEITDLGHDFDQMAERIQSMIAAQRRLLSDISHELRTPLSRLNVALALIRQRAGGGSSDELDRIELESERINKLISHLLTFTRMESGTVEITREEVDLARMLSEVAADARFESGDSNRTVHIISSEPCVTVGNPELLRSAIENVVRNAVYYTADDTRVEIELKLAGKNRDCAIIRVRDHGEGVRESELTDIFRPFYRVAAARERQSGGTGLGLAITQRAVQLHNGSVAASNAPGGGLCMEIRLPVHPESTDPTESL